MIEGVQRVHGCQLQVEKRVRTVVYIDMDSAQQSKHGFDIMIGKASEYQYFTLAKKMNIFLRMFFV